MTRIQNTIGRWATIGSLFVTPLSLGAADITWANGSGGDWNTAANWNPKQVPGPADKAILDSSVIVTVNTNTTVGNLDLSNGTLSGSAALTVRGTLNWTDGTMNGTGTTVIPSGGTLNLSGPNDKTLSQRAINNSGTLIWSGGNFFTGSGAALNNLAGAVFDMQSDQSWRYIGGDPVAVNNTGLWKKTTDTGNTTLQAVVNNNGILDLQVGSLILTGSGVSHGSFNIAAGATLGFAGPAGITLDTNSILTGAGTVSFLGADVNLNGSYNVSNTVISAGAANFNASASTLNATLSGNGFLSGSATLTVRGTLDWTDGTMNGTGTTVIPSGGTLNVSGPNDKTLSQRAINNSGTLIWSGGNFFTGSGAALNNLAGAVFDMQSHQSWRYIGGDPVAVNNTGLWKKTTDTGNTTLQAVVNNNGILDLQVGSLILTGSGVSHGSFNIAAGATLGFAGPAGITLDTNSILTGAGTVSFLGADVNLNGSYNVSNTVISAGAANFNASASTLNATLSGNGFLSGSATLTVRGTLDWTDGTMNGTGTTVIPSGGTLNVSGPNDKTLSQRAINNSGTMIWSGGNLFTGSGAALNNLAGAVFDMQSDQSWRYIGGDPVAVNNTGLWKKTTGTGSTTLQAVVNNDGILDIRSGTISVIGGSYSNATTSVVQGSGTLNISQTAFATDGQFSPGDGQGALQVVGNLPQTSNSAIHIQIGGSNAGVDYDQLVVTGNAALNGTLNIILVNGFHPVGGGTFEILKYASRAGFFDRISGLNLGGGFYLEPTFNSTNLILTTIDRRPQPHFSASRRVRNGDIHFTLSDVAGQTIVIQATTNFLNWDAVLTNVDCGGIFDLIITDSQTRPYRFYQTLQP